MHALVKPLALRGIVIVRVLMVSKACIVGSYQRKLEEIARFSDVELMVVVPPAWNDGSRTVRLERAHVSGYQLVVEPILFNGSFHLHFYPRLGRRLRAYAPDVVHVDEEPYNLATFHALQMAKRAGARTLWFTWQNLNRRYPLPVRLIERYNLRQADYAIAGSDGAAAVWREKGYAGRLAVIPQFGVDPDIFFPRATGQDLAGEITIGYMGRLVREKGVDLLLTALSGVTARWRLIIVGAGPERERLERLADHLGIAHQISFVGVLPSLRTPAFYQELDALVLPSRSQSNWVEQFGRVLIEAMACGVPVVGSDSGEIPHVIGDAGLVFPEDDAKTLADCLHRLAVNPDLRADLGARGRERVLAHFTQARVAEQTVAVYREMITRAS
jgi:glycosyltransferase involved in cell wall biosynthesis